METKSNVKAKRSWEEKKTLCEQWKASGKSKRDFCKENNIPIATFFPWCNKLWPGSKKSSSNLLPIKLIDGSSLASESQGSQTEIELILGEGSAKIHFKLSNKKLITFIQELLHAVATIR